MFLMMTIILMMLLMMTIILMMLMMRPIILMMLLMTTIILMAMLMMRINFMMMLMMMMFDLFALSDIPCSNCNNLSPIVVMRNILQIGPNINIGETQLAMIITI